MEIEFFAPPAEDGAALGVFLRRRGLSLSALRGLKQLEFGITVNGVPARTDKILRAGDRVTLHPAAARGFSARPEAITLKMLYRSRDALAVNKPAGMVTHPDASHHGGTLANAFCGMMAAAEDGAVFRPVGRLDGDTSGLALLAMNAVAAPLLAKTAQKAYLALAGGRLPLGGGVLCAPLRPQVGSAVRQLAGPGGRPSLTEYRVLAAADAASLVLVFPKTGRTHQIRAHFAHIGHPLLGDALYGGGTGLIGRHALHCAGLCFTEPGGNSPRLWCAPPDDIRFAAAALGLAPPRGWLCPPEGFARGIHGSDSSCQAGQYG